MKFVRSLLFALAAGVPVLAQQSTVITPQAIIQMKQVGLSDSVILSTIKSQPDKIPYTVDDLAAMKKAGVSDEVVSAMVSHTEPPAQPAVPVTVQTADHDTTGLIVTEIGAYYQDHENKWVPIPPENLTYRSGGALKSLATNGIIKKDMNGRLAGEKSKLRLASPITLLVYTTDGTAPTEFQLIRMHVHDNRREFRTETGGVFHSQSGAGHDLVEFESKKVAPRTYELLVPQSIVKGEFGLLPPNGGGNAASAGKIYTFSILE